MEAFGYFLILLGKKCICRIPVRNGVYMHTNGVNIHTVCTRTWAYMGVHGGTIHPLAIGCLDLFWGHG